MGCAVLAVATLATTVTAEPPAPSPVAVVLGWIPSRDAAIDRDLEEGARLALATATAEDGTVVTLARGEAAGPWGTIASSAVRLVTDGRAVALVAPPERDAGHLLMQVGTRMHVPVIATSRAPTVGQTGTTWVVRVVARGSAAGERPEPPPFDAAAPGAAAFMRAYRDRFGRAPSAWSVAGHDAARAAVEGLRATRGAGGVDLRRSLRALERIPGATGSFRFDERGERTEIVPAPAPGGGS